MDGKLIEIKIRAKQGMSHLSDKDQKIAIEFIQKYYKNIIEKWVKFFVMKQRIRSTKITKKI